MSSEHAENGEAGGPAVAPDFAWRDIALWLPTCLLLGLLAAWLAVAVQSYFAPLLFFPVLVGVATGAGIVTAMRILQVGHRPTVLFGALAACLLTVVGQHYVAYRNNLRQIAQESVAERTARTAFPDLAATRLPIVPTDFSDFMLKQAARGRHLFGDRVARGKMAWLSWLVDGLLTLSVAMVLVVTGLRQPYCNRCRSWYRTMRNGRIDSETAGQLAEAAGIELDEPVKSARYRLLACGGGCGPTALDLICEDPQGDTASARTWLDVEPRDRVIHVLDAADKPDKGNARAMSQE